MKPSVLPKLLALLLALLLPSALLAQSPEIEIRQLSLVGSLAESGVVFTASGTIAVNGKNGADISLLAGDIALLEHPELKYGKLELRGDAYHLRFDRKGIYPFSLRFLAKVNEADEQRSVAFQFLSAPIRRLQLADFPLDADLVVENAATPTRENGNWVAHLSPDSWIRFNWMPAKSSAEGELFYTAEMTNVAVVAPGLVKQSQKANLQVMQGEMSSLAFELDGAGEISQVEGRDVLGWKIERGAADSRRLVIRFNRPQTGVVALLIRSQTTLPKLPSVVRPLLLEPVDATRVGGSLLLLSDGAVNLGIDSQSNLSQISPDQVPLDREERAALGIAKRQAFAFRFAGSGQSLGIQVVDILPEINVSSIALYHFGLNESTISVEMNLEIREAPLREFSLRLPKDYSVLSVAQANLADYTVADAGTDGQTLRLVYSRPISDRQTLNLKLERNGDLNTRSAALPRVDALDVKSVRGYIGVTADTGIKIVRESDTGLSEVIPSYFPVKNDQLQVAYRLRDPNWTAQLGIERLAASIQAESFHLFSLGDGVSYASTIITYQMSGAPTQHLSLGLDSRFENVDLFGPNIRDWRRVGDTFVVNFHSPISGTYSLLATYEFRSGGADETLAFGGARPIDASTESGYIAFVSSNQIEFKLESIESPLLSLEPQELPPEYQIMIDAPILASFHYPSRPFGLSYGVVSNPREQSIDQVVELAHLNTIISKTGEVLYEANYIVKSKNLPHFALKLPSGARLWKVEADGKEPVVSKDGEHRILIPLESSASGLSRRIGVKFTLQSDAGRPVALASPLLEAPTLQTYWSLQADEGQQLRVVESSILPVNHVAKLSKFSQLENLSDIGGETFSTLLVLGLLALPLLFLLRRFNEQSRLRWLPFFAGLVAVLGLWYSGALGISLGRPERQLAQDSGSRQIAFEDTVLAANESLRIEVLSEKAAATKSASNNQILPMLVVAMAAPALLSLLIRRISSPGAHAAAYAIGNVALCAAFLLLPLGVPLALAYLGALYFWPLLTASYSQARVALRSRPSLPDSAAPGLVSALAVLLLFVSPDANAQIDFDESAYTLKDPIELKAFVNDEYASVQLRFDWTAKTGESIPLLFLPAVITTLDAPDNAVTLGQRAEGDRLLYTLNANRAGKHSIRVEYQTPVTNANGVWNFSIQSIPSLIYQGELLFEREHCEVLSAAAVGIEYRPSSPKRSSVALRFRPVWDLPIVCKPLDRDTRLEESVFYAETASAYRPQAGTIEGIHRSTLRIAQGQLRRVTVAVPTGSTITDVQADWVESWRFDPATQTLNIAAKRPLTGSPTVTFVSQTNAAALPYNAALQVARFPQADSELGWIGLFASPEEQFDSIDAGKSLASVSINDFPSVEGATAGGFKLRRAYRYADTAASLSFALASVEPEIRVESEELTSLSEDRIVHAATLKTSILRSGLFQIQLEIPSDFDIEKITGTEVSHWTESLAAAGQRLVTLHFKGRTEGVTTQYVTISGPGLRENPRWSPPRVSVRGATKQRGTLTLSPELGLRFNILERDGVSQIDPTELGSTDRNRLGFRLLESSWNLVLEAQQVDPWVECQLLQEVSLKTGVAETAATLRFTIKNAGVKQLRLRLPAQAVGPKFTGEHIASFQASPVDPTLWEVKLDRRVIGDYQLGIEYQLFNAADASPFAIAGIESLDTQLQESYLALRAKQRLSLDLAALPSVLSPVEWQQVPEALRKGKAAGATAVYRTIQPRFDFALEAQRLEMAQVLPAEVKSVAISSILSETGQILTRAVYRLNSGHKPYFSVRLPDQADFWACYVEGMSVWPVEKAGALLIPLERTGDYRDAIELELHYLTRQSPDNAKSVNFAFVGPQCDLPLENIEWTLYVPRKYETPEWTGTLEPKPGTGPRLHRASFDLDALLERDARIESEKLKDAEHLLTLGNALAEEGNQLDARRVLNSAYNLSQNDLDFNEDARVQWNNLRVQQAMVGLTSRRAAAFNLEAPAAAPGINFDQKGDYTLNFSRAAADTMLQNANSADENRALSELAQRFVEHQDAALKNPSGLTALYPEHGALYSFTRKLQAEPWQDMRLELKAKVAHSRAGLSWLYLLAAAALLSAASLASRRHPQP